MEKHQERSADTEKTSQTDRKAGGIFPLRQSIFFVVALVVLIGILLFFGYKDWQRQQAMHQELESHIHGMSKNGKTESSYTTPTFSRLLNGPDASTFLFQKDSTV